MGDQPRKQPPEFKVLKPFVPKPEQSQIGTNKQGPTYVPDPFLHEQNTRASGLRLAQGFVTPERVTLGDTLSPGSGMGSGGIGSGDSGGRKRLRPFGKHDGGLGARPSRGPTYPHVSTPGSSYCAGQLRYDAVMSGQKRRRISYADNGIPNPLEYSDSLAEGDTSQESLPGASPSYTPTGATVQRCATSASQDALPRPSKFTTPTGASHQQPATSGSIQTTPSHTPGFFGSQARKIACGSVASPLHNSLHAVHPEVALNNLIPEVSHMLEQLSVKVSTLDNDVVVPTLQLAHRVIALDKEVQRLREKNAKLDAKCTEAFQTYEEKLTEAVAHVKEEMQSDIISQIEAEGQAIQELVESFIQDQETATQRSIEALTKKYDELLAIQERQNETQNTIAGLNKDYDEIRATKKKEVAIKRTSSPSSPRYPTAINSTCISSSPLFCSPTIPAWESAEENDKEEHIPEVAPADVEVTPKRRISLAEYSRRNKAKNRSGQIRSRIESQRW